MRFLHISDAHFGYEQVYGSGEVTVARRQRYLDRLRQEIVSHKPYDFILFSGDIAFQAKKEEYEQAADWLNRLLEECGLPPERLFLCPGNHDNDRAEMEGITYPENQKQAEKYLTTKALPTMEKRRFAAYAEFCRELGVRPYTLGSLENRLVGMGEVDGVRILSLNTAWFSGNEAGKKNMWVGAGFWELMARQCEIEPKPTIAIMHHPQKHWHEDECSNYAEKTNVYQQLCQCADLILSGHTHEQTVDLSYEGCAAVTGVGALCERENYPNSFHIYDLDLSRRENQKRLECILVGSEWLEKTRPFDLAPRKSTVLPRSRGVVHHSADVERVILRREDLPEVGTKLLPRTEPEGLFRQWYSTIHVGADHVPVAYRELFGNAEAGELEYVEGKNLFVDYEPVEPAYGLLRWEQDFKEEVEQRRRDAAALGYMDHPPKLWLTKHQEKKYPDGSSALELRFGQCGYLEHKVYRAELAKNEQERKQFAAVIRQPRGVNDRLHGCVWTLCGGGVWILTSDGYLVMSHRKRVGEMSGFLSYSASGAFERTNYRRGVVQDNTPGLGIRKEMREELGLSDVPLESLRLVSLGIDLVGCHVQFSYFYRSDLTAAQLYERKENYAITPDEQKTYFVDPTLCADLLTRYTFEPGAAYSLKRLMDKGYL